MNGSHWHFSFLAFVASYQERKSMMKLWCLPVYRLRIIGSEAYRLILNIIITRHSSCVTIRGVSPASFTTVNWLLLKMHFGWVGGPCMEPHCVVGFALRGGSLYGGPTSLYVVDSLYSGGLYWTPLHAGFCVEWGDCMEFPCIVGSAQRWGSLCGAPLYGGITVCI